MGIHPSNAPSGVRRVLRILLRTVLGLLSALLLYVLIAVVLLHIPVAGEAEGDDDVTAYVRSNGMHTDIIVPVRTPAHDWSRTLPFSNTVSGDTTVAWVAFGWGDKGFYLEIPTWDDLTARVAFRAVFGLSGSAMHVTYHHNMQEDDQCKRLHLSSAQYKRLIAYIEASFARDARGNTQAIATKAQVGRNDAFYESEGRYSLFNTCNSWTNSALKACGQKACVWTPTVHGIMGQYD